MDPFTISLAGHVVGLCTKASIALVSLINRSQKVDDELDNLRIEIDSLGRVIKSIETSLLNGALPPAMALFSPGASLHPHWKNFTDSLTDCQGSLTDLDNILGCVEKCEGQFLRLKKQVKLELKSGQIKLLKERIRNSRRTMDVCVTLMTFIMSS